MISVATGVSVGAAVGVGVLFFLFTAAITFVISTLVAKSKANNRN